MVEGNFTEADKLLICLALILLLTIVWTILIGIMYKMRGEKVVSYKKSRFIEDDEDDEEDEKEYIPVENIGDLETYVKIRFNRTNKNLIYKAPDRIQLEEGQKIKVRVDDDTVKNATVVKGNYIREKYKANYKELELEY